MLCSMAIKCWQYSSFVITTTCGWLLSLSGASKSAVLFCIHIQFLCTIVLFVEIYTHWHKFHHAWNVTCIILVLVKISNKHKHLIALFVVVSPPIDEWICTNNRCITWCDTRQLYDLKSLIIIHFCIIITDNLLDCSESHLCRRWTSIHLKFNKPFLPVSQTKSLPKPYLHLLTLMGWTWIVMNWSCSPKSINKVSVDESRGLNDYTQLQSKCKLEQPQRWKGNCK